MIARASLSGIRIGSPAPGEPLWDRSGQAARRLELREWRSRAFSEREMRRQFTSPDAIVCVVREHGRLVGFACAGPSPARSDRSSSTLFNILIAPERRGTGLLGRLMRVLEGELRSKGFGSLYVDARVGNGFADSIERHYGERATVVRTDHPSRWGLQRTIRIDLRRPR